MTSSNLAASLPPCVYPLLRTSDTQSHSEQPTCTCAFVLFSCLTSFWWREILPVYV